MLILMLLLSTWIATTTLLLCHVFEVTILMTTLSVLIGLGAMIIMLLLVLLITMIYMSLYRKQTSRSKSFIVRCYARFALIILRVKVKVHNKENLPKDRPYVVYANHKSMVDILVAFVVYKGKLAALAKKEVFSYPFVGFCMKRCGFISIDRENDKATAKEYIKAIKLVKDKNFNYVVFPEGGIRDRSTNLMVELKPGAYKLAQKGNAVISPCAIIGLRDYGSKPFLKRKAKVNVIIQKPIMQETFKDKSTTELGQEVMDIINNTVKEYDSV